MKTVNNTQGKLSIRKEVISVLTNTNGKIVKQEGAASDDTHPITSSMFCLGLAAFAR